MALAFQAVVLASDTGSRLYPLNSSATPKALLPIGNKAMLSFPLAMLEAGGVREVLVVCSGEATAGKIQAWIHKHYTGSMHLEVKTVAENLGTAEAVRAVSDSIRTDNFVLLSSDLVTDLPLRSLIAAHYIRGSLVSSLLYKRRISPSSETKPGKAPKNVDYVGLDESKQRLLFFASSSLEAKLNIKIPLRALRKFGLLTVRTDLVDSHMYIFNREALMHLLIIRPTFTSIKQHVAPAPALESIDSELSVDSATRASHNQPDEGSSLSDGRETANAADYTVADCKVISGLTGVGCSAGGLCSVVLAAEGHYCARANNPHNFGEVNRDVATPQLALHLLGPPTNPKHDNWLDPSVKLGSKTTVGPGCIIGANTTVGDKGSVKRSVVGLDCKIGSNAKVINSVLMDGVVVGEHSHIQNSIVCSNSRLHDHCYLRDCQVGAGYLVAEGSEHRDEILAKILKPV